MRRINILGTTYTVSRVKKGQDTYMDKMGFAGYCCDVEKKIVILDLKSVPAYKDDTDEYRKKCEDNTLRHEVIHAFLNESGLAWNSFPQEKAWAKNEEMVDWFAIQFPRILEVYRKLGCIE